MSKPLSKKRVERRKKPRSKGRSKLSRHPRLATGEACPSCRKDLRNSERALFVEEEVGRVFCSEECIAAYFAPEVEQLEKEYFHSMNPATDLTPEKREELSYLRWITLEEPDEVWREQTKNGDYRYTLISEFKPSSKPVWYICICLLLRGEPSFLYLAFPTLDAQLVERYRRGEAVQWIRPRANAEEEGAAEESEAVIDGLAEPWTDDETLRAQISQKRRSDDIPLEEYELYQGCMQETLEEPDELWSLNLPTTDEKPKKVFHFIRFYPEQKNGVWFIIVARETKDENQIEVVDAFPTRDPELVERYRQGEQELGGTTAPTPSRLVH